MTGFRIRLRDDEYQISEVFAGEETPLSHCNSFQAALAFISVRRQLSMPKSYSFTIEFIGG